MKEVTRLVLACLLVWVSSACGAAGPPIAPEDVGLEAKIRKQQKPRQTMPPGGEGIEEPIPLEEEPVELPDLHPVRTR